MNDMESSAVVNHAETSDEIQPLTILDLNLELITKIISNKCINLRDRINLRSTCRPMERAVAQSDYKRNGKWLRDLSIYQSLSFNRHGISDSKTILSRENRRKKDKRKEFSACRFSSYAHLMSRLFRRWFFENINISFSKKHGESELFISSLLELSTSLSCESLCIKVNNQEEYDARIFDIIGNIHIREELELDLGTAVVEKEYLLNLPSVEFLEISTYHGCTLSSETSETLAVDDSVFLALISKHRYLTLNAEPCISQQALEEARKIVNEDDHDVRFTVPRDMIEKTVPAHAKNFSKDIRYFCCWMFENKRAIKPLYAN